MLPFYGQPSAAAGDCFFFSRHDDDKSPNRTVTALGGRKMLGSLYTCVFNMWKYFSHVPETT